MTDLESLVGRWGTIPEIAQLLGIEKGQVKRLLRERQLIGTSTTADGVFKIPLELLTTTDGRTEPLASLPGTLHLLTDGGLSDDGALVWLFTVDDSLPGRPIDALQGDQRREVRRRAQALAV